MANKTRVSAVNGTNKTQISAVDGTNKTRNSWGGLMWSQANRTWANANEDWTEKPTGNNIGTNKTRN